MRCPNCSAEHSDEDQECPKCGFVTKKWQTGTLSPGHLIGKQKEEESSPLVLYGGLAAAVMGYWFFFRTSAAPPPAAPAAVEASDSAAVAVPAGAPVASSAGGADGETLNPWKVQGRVVNVRNGAPVAEAKITFTGGGKAIDAATDSEGLYKAELPPLQGGAYAITVSHRRFHPPYLKGTTDVLPEEHLRRVDCAAAGRREDFAGGNQGETIDLMLCPNGR